MITFNPENKSVVSFAECLDPVIKIKTRAEAQQYLKDYADYIEWQNGNNPEEMTKSAEEIAKSNIGYWTGYYNYEDRARVEDLFDCEHPIFGKFSEMGIPSADEVFQCGFHNITLKELRERNK